MTLQLTERDKKLLVILAVFVLIVGVGAGVLMPLLDKGQELQEKQQMPESNNRNGNRRSFPYRF